MHGSSSHIIFLLLNNDKIGTLLGIKQTKIIPTIFNRFQLCLLCLNGIMAAHIT